jgi:hypothetical protein
VAVAVVVYVLKPPHMTRVVIIYAGLMASEMWYPIFIHTGVWVIHPGLGHKASASEPDGDGNREASYLHTVVAHPEFGAS